MKPLQHLYLNPSQRQPLLREQQSSSDAPEAFPTKTVHTHPKHSHESQPPEDASVSFIGTATTIIEWQGIRILTDPNFLHKGDHVHLGPGVTAERLTNPAVDLNELPPIDLVLLSHYHEDHFDRLVEDSLNRAFPIVTTPHAKGCLTPVDKSKTTVTGSLGPFSNVHDLDFFDSLVLHIGGNTDGQPAPIIKITGMPGKHVPPGPLAAINNLLGAVPPTNGWLLEMGWTSDTSPVSSPSQPSPSVTSDAMTVSPDVGYTIYISGDTLLVDELKSIPPYLRTIREQQQKQSPSAPQKESNIDLMLIHLGGTTIPGPNAPLLMVTMDGKQGVELMKLLNPDLTIPIHFDDYSVFLSPLSDFKEEVKKLGKQWEDRVVYLDRGDTYRFRVDAGDGKASRVVTDSIRKDL
ncbi:Metallo-hydrolase/oxidoreductase [Xylariaceae sp. FL1272]|nr:Metallo-hydrolase/oxidoreductase [Xylariaceae sp. FL1272]